MALVIQRAIREETAILWQFVLVPNTEEPLDLLDYLIAVTRRLPMLMLDRSAPILFSGQLASRRILVELPRDRRFSRAWVTAADTLLRQFFH